MLSLVFRLPSEPINVLSCSDMPLNHIVTLYTAGRRAFHLKKSSNYLLVWRNYNIYFYYPAGQLAQSVLATLVRLIMTTKMKVCSAHYFLFSGSSFVQFYCGECVCSFSNWVPISCLNLLLQAICNLAVWCISVQQLEALVVEDGVTPLLNAIVYALDNPFGSLSTTFEAVQVIFPLRLRSIALSLFCLVN